MSDRLPVRQTGEKVNGNAPSSDNCHYVTSDDSVRAKVMELLADCPGGLAFPGQVVQALIGPCVYVWHRGDEVLYVGMSRRGGARFFSRRHEHLNIGPDDMLTVWPMPSKRAAFQLEGALIRRLRPKHNINVAATPPSGDLKFLGLSGTYLRKLERDIREWRLRRQGRQV
jgi:hypothetical protein